MRVWTFVGPAVGKSRLDEDPGHEAEGAGSAGFLGFDRERLLGELRCLRGAATDGDRKSLPAALPILSPGRVRGVSKGPTQDLPEAMRTVVSTRQGEASGG